ncbi:MAG TPA: Hpt domain-containing protein [Gammaproteobacteria bacterium]|nr:Hpt domain-containing protein [Gammaproteobacteria bacterium]
MTEKITVLIRRLLGRPCTENDMPGPGQAAPGDPPLLETDENFSHEMFVQLLLELPVHRRDIAVSWQAGDLQRLRNCVHRLLGATVYCAAPELEEALRNLRRALHTQDGADIAWQHARTLAVIDTTLNGCGHR